MGASFLCICPPKSIRFDDSKDLSQAEISARLDSVSCFRGQPAGQLCLPGAGAVYIPALELSVATEGSCFAVFKGQLDNYPYLVRKYCSKHLQQDQTLTLNQIKQAAPLTDAQVICELYQTLGTAFLTKLKGDFAFVCYDSRKVRVLAARGASGAFDLWQARGSDASLCVGSGDCMPQGCHTKLEIQPGHFKYGWYADPQRFAAALSDSTTNAATSAAQKAMEGITIAPAKSSPLELRRESSSSGADASSQSWYMSRTASTALTAPITISGQETSSASLASSMYTETLEGSIISDSSMMTTRTNKTRRGKRGGKKQRENSQQRKQQSLPQSPIMASSPSGSQADQHGWWRSSRSEKALAQRSRAKQGFTAQDFADDVSGSDAASAMSLGDMPKGAFTPPSLHGSADAAWGQDGEEEATDTLMPLLSTSLKGPLPTVMEHFDEGIGMSRPQSLADLSKAGWTVDNALLQASANAKVSRMSRISSFPCLGTMPETVTDSTGGSSPHIGFPPYTSQQGMSDLSNHWASVLGNLAPEANNDSTDAQRPIGLNPHAVTFKPGMLSAQLHQATAPTSIATGAIDTAQSQHAYRNMLATNTALAGPGMPEAAASPFLHLSETEVKPGFTQQLHDIASPAGGFAQALESRQKSVSIAELARQADKSVARRLLLKKRTPSFGKSKSCNDLAAAEPTTPTRSPLAPLGNFAQ